MDAEGTGQLKCVLQRQVFVQEERGAELPVPGEPEREESRVPAGSSGDGNAASVGY